MVCGTKVAERDVQVVELQPDLVVLQRKLAGLCPNDMLTAVAHGIKFWDDQLELRYRTELEKSFTAAQRNSEMYKRKLQVTNCARARRHVALALNRNIHVLRINQSSSLLRRSGRPYRLQKSQIKAR